MAAVVGYVIKELAAKIISKLIVMAVKVAAAYAVSRAITKSARSQGRNNGLGSGSGNELTMSRDPAPARRVVYGETRVSGPVAFLHVSGTDNSALGCAVLLAAHECQGIAYHYVDDVLVYPDPSTGAVTFGPYSGKLIISSHLGDQTTADAGLVSSSNWAWGSSYTLRGIAYIACRLTYDADVYAGGLPNFSVLLRGKKVFDPRTSTTAFSRNPALILRDYLLDSDYGLGATADEIDDASFIAAANICDEAVPLSSGGTEPRYRCDGSFTTDAEPAAVIEQILATMAGRLVYAGGKFRCISGAYYIPTVALDEGDLRGPIQYQTAAGIREACNVVKGTYTSPADLYQPRDFPQYRDAAHVADDGEEIVEDLDLAWVSSASQAQRLAKIHEKASRLGGTITLQCNLSAMRVQAGDTVAINNTRFGWAPKVFVVQEFKFSVEAGGALGVDLVCRETSPSVFGWVASDEITVLPGLTITNPALNNGVVIQASLNNDSATVPSAADGSSPVLGPAVTTVSIYRGAIDDSANWAVSASPSAGVTGTLAGKTWTTTGFTVDAGYVDFTATRSGYSPITVRFVLAKALAGAAGSPGANGLNSATVMLYKRSASAPSKPTTISTYTFATAALTGHNNGWTQTIPANDGNPLYAIAATASSTGATDMIATGEWSSPVVMAQNGANGASAFTLVNDARCAVGPNWIQRTSGGAAWDAAAHTLESYVGAAFCSFRISAGSDLMAGLNSDPTTNNSFDSIDYGWVGWSNGTSAVFSNGSQLTGAFAYTAETVFAVTYDGKQVQFLMDGVVKHTVSASAGLRLFFDSSFYSAAARVTNIAFGPSGAAGANGADATAYWLVTSSPTLKLAGSTFTPATVTFTGKSQTGAGVPGDYGCRFIIAESTDGSNFTTVYTSSANEASKVYIPSGATVKAIRCRMYQAGGTSALVDEENVNVVSDGTNGTSGGTVLGSIGGSNSITGTGGPQPASNTALSVSAPAGGRVALFEINLSNTSGSSGSFSAHFYESGSIVKTYGPVTLGSGQTYTVSGTHTHTRGSAGTQTYQLGGTGPNGVQYVVAGGITAL